jgi:aminoglycoside phosphotransferase (APT) family kinase protein
MPAAEVDVNPDLVRRLLAAQQPDLAQLAIELMTNGWANAMYRGGDELVARLPRREVAAELVIREQRWLPVLAPRLPLPVPAPIRTGQPALGYPWSWSIIPFLPGQSGPVPGRPARSRPAGGTSQRGPRRPARGPQRAAHPVPDRSERPG